MSCKLRFSNFVQSFRKLSTRNSVRKKILPILDTKVHLPDSEYDTEFLCNPVNRDIIKYNIRKRKSAGDIDLVLELNQQPDSQDALRHELSKIPNMTYAKVLENSNEEPQVLKTCGSFSSFDFKPQEFTELATNLRMLKMENMGAVSGQRSYVLMGDLAELENALVHYAIQKLIKHKFNLVSVPDILPTPVIERCGLIVDGQRKLVYEIEPHYGDDLSLSGTAEMALANKLTNCVLLENELPLKLAAVSRCFRAEISGLVHERGIYRVHQFTKVEMFACCTKEKSMEFMDELCTIQEDMFKDLGLSFKVLDMPPRDLGAPAYRKIDIEGWMPGKNMFGELSSCSNCIDFQSRRLNIKYKQEDNNQLVHVHTLNGTACAIPRLLIAIIETYQTKHGNVNIPEVLIPYMNGKTTIEMQSRVPNMRLYKYKPKLQH